MRQYTKEDIQEQFEKIPADLQSAATSPEISENLYQIGQKHGLHIDQIGVLVDMVGLVMIGLIPSKDFTHEFQNEAGVSSEVAGTITEAINSEVLAKIRDSIQALQESADLEITRNEEIQSNTLSPQIYPQSTNNASFEKAADLSLEKEEAPNTAFATAASADLESPAHILDGIENPQTGNEKISRKQEQTYTEPMMDHVLQNPVAQVQKKSALFSTGLPSNPTQPAEPPKPVAAPATPLAPTAPAAKRAGPDPYKEPVS